MKISSFSFKNLCSFGNKLQEIKFSDQPELILIRGENGHGKSSILNALTFSLYGKSQKRKIKELANRLNKNCQTNIDFYTRSGKKVYLSRGISPNSYEIKVDGDKPMTIANKDSLDRYVENELIGIPFDVFVNTVSMSVNDFKSFIKMKAEDKRKIVNKIFPIEKIDSMRETLAGESTAVDREFSNVEYALLNIESTLEQQRSEMASLEEKMKSVDAEKIKQLESEVLKMSSDLSSADHRVLCIIKEAADASKEMKSLDDGFSDSVSTLANQKAEKLGVISSKVNAEMANLYEQAKADKVSSVEAAKAEHLKEYEMIKKLAAEAEEKMDSAIDAKIKKAKEDEMSELEEIMSNHESKVLDISKKRADVAKSTAARDAMLMAAKGKLEEVRSRASVLSEKIDNYSKGVCSLCDHDLKGEVDMTKLAKMREEFTYICETQEPNILREIEEIKASIDQLIKEKEDLELKATECVAEFVKATSDCKDKWSKARSDIEKKRRELKDAIEVKSIGMKSAADVKKETCVLDAERAYEKKVEKLDEEKKKKTQDASADIIKKIDEEASRLKVEYEAKKKKIQESKSEIDSRLQSEKDLASSLRLLYESKRSELETLKSGSKTDETMSVIQSMIDQTINKIKSLTHEKESLKAKKSVIDKTKEMLSEDGVKKMIMAKFMPVFNATIERLIGELECEFHLSFDDEFEPKITHMGEDVSADSPSSGEGKLMDIIVILAMLELLKYKNPEMNIMFLDEVFNSLDVKNIQKVVAILKKYVDRFGMTVFVISHTPVPVEYFDVIIDVFKEDYFSDMKILR